MLLHLDLMPVLLFIILNFLSSTHILRMISLISSQVSRTEILMGQVLQITGYKFSRVVVCQPVK
jgi:hypothetical protein